MAHPFCEGNTRTVAVFLMLHLNSMGFDVINDAFVCRASFFRDALVRATYQNRPIGVVPELGHLMQFLSKLVDDPETSLDYDALIVCAPFRVSRPREKRVACGRKASSGATHA